MARLLHGPGRFRRCLFFMIGVGTKDKLRPSLRTGQANFLHPALQLVVTFKKIDTPQRVLALRCTSPLW